MTKICPTQHEKNEWRRVAQDAYRLGLNDVGHVYSCAASLRKADEFSVAYFDHLQRGYREWLINGFGHVCEAILAS